MHACGGDENSINRHRIAKQRGRKGESLFAHVLECG